MNKLLAASTVALLMTTTIIAKTRTVEFRVIETSDVHGAFFSYDFIKRQPKEGSLARVASYVKRLRDEYGDKLILLDNGDILQGQPTCYYHNFINTKIKHIAAEIVNDMKYDAETVGNHDIETGHQVYDRWAQQLKCPLLAANVLRNDSEGEPYFKPYSIIERDGVRIAVIGMLTPAIPNWLNENLWSGMHFENMLSAAKKWMKIVREKEKAQIVIGLFHSGRNGGIHDKQYDENASMEVARQIPGFDLVLYGHDHTKHRDVVKNINGDDVLCLDPSCEAFCVSDAKINLEMQGKRIIRKTITGDLHDITDEQPDAAFMKTFQYDIDSINNFVNRRIGTIDTTIYIRDAYFGSSTFIDLIHNLQLQLTGAQISIAAPLSFNSVIKQGDIHVSDMFELYRYENMIYKMRLTGKEVKGLLEMSYDLWVNTMKSPDDHIMLLADSKEDKQRAGFKNLAFNFDSAAGIIYTVDVTKPDGQKVNIASMADGTPFDENTTYDVALNSYRGNGGGELLTKGAGIPRDSLPSRITYASDRDQRYYLIQLIKKAGMISPRPNNNWRFVPDEWAKPAIERDRKLIFNS